MFPIVIKSLSLEMLYNTGHQFFTSLVIGLIHQGQRLTAPFDKRTWVLQRLT